MTKSIRWLVTFVLCMTFAHTHTTRAQDTVDPIIILNNGDLWAWDGSGNGLQQMTDWGFNQEPVLSPDGQHVAYMAWSSITVDALQREGAVGGGEVPGDIKILDVASKQEAVIAAQPSGASFFNQGVADNAVIRSQPVWSPDSKQLAWTEYDYPGVGVSRVMVYDLSTAALTTVVPDLPAQAGVPVPMEMAWGETGFIVRSTMMNLENPAIFDDSFLVYGTNGALRATVPVPQTEQRFMTQFIVVSYGDKEYIGVLYNTDEWDLFDPLTGSSQPAPYAPEVYCLSAPEKSISMLLKPDVEGDGVDYQLLDVDGNPVGKPIDLGVNYEGRVALSPSGRAAAFVQYDSQQSTYGSSVIIWNNGEVSAKFDVNPLGFSFLWGPTAWRIRDKEDQAW
jgi:WD40 repeat protein